MNIHGSESGTQTGNPTVVYGPPVTGVQMRVESTAPLVKFEKPGHPTAYFYARGVSIAGEYVAFTGGHPGPDYMRVQVTGPIAAMGINPDTVVFIRRDDPFAALAEVWHD